jgi:hypothetical protein
MFVCVAQTLVSILALTSKTLFIRLGIRNCVAYAMDDPWGNAWVEPSEQDAGKQPQKTKNIDSSIWSTADDDAELFTKPFGAGSITTPASWSLRDSSTEDAWGSHDADPVSSWVIPSAAEDKWNLDTAEKDGNSISPEGITGTDIKPDDAAGSPAPITPNVPSPGTPTLPPTTHYDEGYSAHDVSQVDPPPESLTSSELNPVQVVAAETVAHSLPSSPNAFGNFTSGIAGGDSLRSPHWPSPKDVAYTLSTDNTEEEPWGSTWTAPREVVVDEPSSQHWEVPEQRTIPETRVVRA